ncbi:MAG: asparagine synthase (glutamine-hydrolyzing) [Candidatus Hermodarchaeota archaeon]
MCGICGFNFENKQLLKQMCNLIHHRGPDDEGYYVDSNISMGMRRLSIIDLSTGNQPQHNENNDMWIIFNGEIYNFVELKDILEKKGHNFYTKSDTEVILHAYEEWGEVCVKKLRGQFSFCIYDSNNHRLFLARDHIGLKPLYYYFDEERFIFGSEIKTILLHGIKREINLRALDYYLSLRFVPFDLTLFKGIFKLPPSSYMLYNLKTKQINIKKYWDITINQVNDKNVDLLAKELKSLIEDSVKIRLISDVPLGAFLSGGLDSSAVVAIMSKFMNNPVKTFSVGFEEGAPINEAKYSQLVSDYYNTDHTELLVKFPSYELLPELIWYLDDLIADAATIPVYIMAKHAKERMTVALTGDGADEVFAGYSSEYNQQRFEFFKYIPNNLLGSTMRFYDYLPFHKMQLLISYIISSKNEFDRYARFILKVPDEEKRTMISYKSTNIKDLIKTKLPNNIDIINKFTLWDLKYQLPNQYNMKVDKMTMAASLEARVPLLDRKIIKWSTSIPSELKYNGKIDKYIFRLAMKDILPPVIIKRRKTGFGTPVSLWLRQGLREVSDSILERLEKRTFMKSKYVKTIKKNRANKLYMDRAWNLIMFELWYETFMERKELTPIKI